MSLKVMIPMLHAAIQTQTMPGLMKLKYFFFKKHCWRGLMDDLACYVTLVSIYPCG